MKKMKAVGMDHLLDALEESLEGLRLGEEDSGDARAKARIAEAIWRIVNGVDDEKTDSGPRWPTTWEPY